MNRLSFLHAYFVGRCDDVLYVNEVKPFSILKRGSIVIEDIEKYYRIVKWFVENFGKVCKLISLYEYYDMRNFVGSHLPMSRRVIRLNKLIYLLENIYVYTGIPYSEFFREEVLALKDIVDVLKFYEDEIHRIRDKVHRFVYTVIQHIFEEMRYKEFYYEGRAWILHASFTYNPYQHSVNTNISIDVQGEKFGKIKPINLQTLATITERWKVK